MSIDSTFQWSCHPTAATWVTQWILNLVKGLPFVEELETRMQLESGTRLFDWTDHLVIPVDRVCDGELEELGFLTNREAVNLEDSSVAIGWRHPGGLFPTVLIADVETPKLSIRVESVRDFLTTHQLRCDVNGQPAGPLREATVVTSPVGRFGIIERHGSRDFFPKHVAPETILASLECAESFEKRRRQFDRDEDGFRYAAEQFDRAAAMLGVDWACDLFFAAERRFWQNRNRAARIQKSRQDRLGLGWANHDHHTYRSSREHFAALIELLERMGFEPRERFYGGAEAGWGAQVMEQANAGVVVFADVDLSPQEVQGDFAHQGLPARNQLGTVGLWCALHGEAMLQAGLHHLECQFDFASAESQLAAEGITTMPKFTDFDFLKQAFSEGEIWQVDQDRLQNVLRRGAITEAQAESFRQRGVLGSHLEILQRNDGYKGFNQTGISEIIRETDPRLGNAS